MPAFALAGGFGAALVIGAVAGVYPALRAARLSPVLPAPFRRSPGLMQSRNLAARAGRWSAQHRKTAILGWIVFVVLATVLGGKVGQNDIDESAPATASPSAAT